MKRILSLMLAAVLAGTMVSCGSQTPPEQSQQSILPPSSSQQEQEEQRDPRIVAPDGEKRL